MTHRIASIKLDPKEARCIPSKACARKHACVRYMAPIPIKYATVMDGTVDQSMFNKTCTNFLEMPK